MTAVCPGNGVATPKPEFGSIVSIGAAALGAKFANTANWASVFIAAFIGEQVYELTTFCPNGPPTIPTLTASDFASLLQPQLDLLAFNNARKKLSDWVGGMVWYDLCDCPAGPQPTAPAPQAPPANIPSFNPPQFPGPVTVPCRKFQTFESGIAATQSFSRGGTQPVGLTGSWIKWNVTNKVAIAPGVTITFELKQQGGSPLTNLRIDSIQLGPGTSGQKIVPFFSNAVSNINCDSTSNGGGGTGLDQHFVEIYCNGDSPGAVQTPCCPPDPTLDSRINQLLDLVTLIQRQLVPFAYIAGSVRSGLTATGSFAIQGILGAKIALTTIPGQLGRSGLLPEELFDAGFVTFSVADGYPHSQRIEHNPQVILPARASVFTTLSYDFHPGVVATITELKRES